MNKKDESGRPIGYWIEIDKNNIWKGNYVDGRSNGIWRKYSKDPETLERVILFELGYVINYITWEYNQISYITCDSKSDLIHIEEYE